MKVIGSLLFAVLADVFVSLPAAAQSQPQDRAKLIEDARKEAKVLVYVSSNASDAKALKSAFEKRYPFINMEYYSSGKDALLSRYLLEARTALCRFRSLRGRADFHAATEPYPGAQRRLAQPTAVDAGPQTVRHQTGVERHLQQVQRRDAALFPLTNR